MVQLDSFVCKKRNSRKWFCLVPGIMTGCILAILFVVFEYAPFGSNTLAVMDADIQYLDFFAYLKNVLCGKDDISYCFGKTLGGTNIAVFSYYLASPLNLLVLLFQKEDLHTFFHLLVLLKLSMAASTCYIFLSGRYGDRLEDGIAGLLSLGYALCQYNIAQSSNVMWLDGVYLLPLILLGVYKTVQNEVGSSSMLKLSVGKSLLFNWYTGVINCLFSALWFCLESTITWSEYRSEGVNKIRKLCCAGMRYTGAMLTGGLLSGMLFIPTLAALQGNRGGIDWNEFGFGVTGEFPSAIQAYIVGGKSALGKVSLFCGSMVVIACIGCFVAKKISRKEKYFAAVLLIGILLLFYWRPCYFTFSLFKRVGSYWYRYSYVGILGMVFLAAFFGGKCVGKEIADTIIRASAIFSAVLLLLQYLKPVQEDRQVYLTIVFAWLSAFAFALYSLHRNSKLRGIFFALLILVVGSELIVHSVLLMRAYQDADALEYSAYVKGQQRQIDELQHYDNGVYRISQTETRNKKVDNLTSNYNEAIAYGYWSISGYTSNPDEAQRQFLDRLGYPINGSNFCITNTSILPADALLGVKYILSPMHIKGLERVQDMTEENGKSVYRNPYCLPFAFRYNKVQPMPYDSTDPFLYQNSLYIHLTGREDMKLYLPVSYTLEEISENSRVWHLEVPEGNYVLYGNLPWDQYIDAGLDVNGFYSTGYAKWLSPSVFYIPVKDRENGAVVRITSKKELCIGKGQFYVLDLDCLAEASQLVCANAAEEILVENGYVKLVADNAAEGEYLYSSVPYDLGWQVKVNGEKVEAETFDGCIITVPLNSGKNVIEMEYHVPYLSLGIVMTIAGFVFLIKPGRILKRFPFL